MAAFSRQSYGTTVVIQGKPSFSASTFTTLVKERQLSRTKQTKEALRFLLHSALFKYRNRKNELFIKMKLEDDEEKQSSLMTEYKVKTPLDFSKPSLSTLK